MGEKKFGLVAVTSLALTALIGTGWFFGPELSAQYGGAASIITWVILGLNSIYVALLFSELAALHPKSGGIYEYAKHAYGRFPSFMVGWVMWLVATVNSGVLTIAALTFAFPGLPHTHLLIAAIVIIIVLHLIAYKGVGASEAILDFFVFTLLAFVVLTIVGGWSHADTANYEPFLVGAPILLLVGLFFILETYFGWEAVCFLAEETKDPVKNIPRALIIASVVAAVLGTLLTALVYAIMPAGDVAGNEGALRTVFGLIFGERGVLLMRIGVFLAFIGSAAGQIISTPRLILSMARDKLFIEQFADVDARTGTPAKAIFLQGIISIFVVIQVTDYNLLLSVLVPLAILMYIAVILAVPILRIRQPGPRPFKAPFAWPGSIFSALLLLASLVAWVFFVPGAKTLVLFIAALIAIGFPIYLLLSTYYNPSTQLFFSDALAYPALMLESFVLPKQIRKRMTALFGSLKGKTVLEFGAGVGSFTMHIAEEVTSSGRVFAIEAGKNNIRVLLRRIKRARHEHVHVISDEHITSRLHPEVRNIDAVFSVGMLGYIQDKQKVLKEIGSIMPEHAPICFIEYIDYFGVLPDPKWLKDREVLKDEFRRAGFSVHVEKVSGLAWNYLVVYGFKSSSGEVFI